MKKNHHLLFVILTCLSIAINVKAQNEPYKDASLSISKRVDDLVSRMTLDEKISQMMNEAVAIPRLGIPYYDWWNEGLHGVARTGIATVFPQAIGLAATFNDNLLYKVATVISDEFRAKYNEYMRNKNVGFIGLTVWSPNINIFRDPRWGRGQETYGEDPFLTARMGVAFVKGMQGNDPVYLKTVATPKHYVVHSGPEPLRHKFDVDPTERDFFDTYAPAFEACIKEAKAYSIMSAYNSFRGIPISASKYLLNDLLRDQWGFKGYVVSDCDAVSDIYSGHKYVSSLEEAAALAVKAGCDLNCGRTYSHLKEAIEKGYLTEKDIDVSVKRLMEARFRLGMFDPENKVPYNKISPSVNDSKEHRKLSILAAQQSLVLLKNEKNILPLKKNLNSIAVIGPNADSPEVMFGNYNGTPSKYVTPLQGIKNKVSKQTKVYYAFGNDCVEGQKTPNVIPVKYLFSGEGQGLKGEYFSNIDLAGKPAAVRIDSTINFVWDGKSPAGNISAENYSVRWTGELKAPDDGEYQLSITGDDGFRLFLDDSLVINDWIEHAPFTKTCSVNFQKNSKHKIRLEYFQKAGGASIQFAWYIYGIDRAKEALEIAKKTDVIIYCGGISPLLEGEEMNVPYVGFDGGDRTTIDLPAVQEKMLKELKATGKPVIFVMLNGSALAVNWENENLPAILEAWYPGQEGGTAIADVLFGDYNPSGKLPVTFYKSTDQLPPFEDYNLPATTDKTDAAGKPSDGKENHGRTYRYFEGEPLYPFGYGLSYTSFEIKNPRLSSNTFSDGDTVKLFVDVTNTGKRTGDEIVQLYLKGNPSLKNAPIKSLKGFKRIGLKPGETKTVEFEIGSDNLNEYVDGKGPARRGGLVVEKGEHTLLIGSSSSDPNMKEIKLTVK